MDQEKIKYKYIGMLALKYRLSLSSIKSIFEIDLPLDEIYNKILKYNVGWVDYEDYPRFCYLLTAETVNERPSLAALSRKNARLYMKEYGTIIPRRLMRIELDIEKAEKEGNTELLEKLNKEKEAYYEIHKEEIEYRDFKEKYFKNKASLASGMDIIYRYRIKNAISQAAVCEDLGVHPRNMYNTEQAEKDPILIEKMKKLNDFMLTISNFIQKREGRKK